MHKRKAFITGITGQDGSYLAELLLQRDYEVYGLIRRSATDHTHNILHLLGQIELVPGDMCDSTALAHAIATIKPDEVYNLAAQSDVGLSWSMPEFTFDVNATGTLRLLEACHKLAIPPRFYQASTSEMFGEAYEACTETTRFDPVSPYAVSKLAAHQMCLAYDQAHNLPIGIGIAFNHESPRRGVNFVSSRIIRQCVACALGNLSCITLGSPNSRRDWGYAPEYVEAMYRICRSSTICVLATGVDSSVKDFATYACTALGIKNMDNVVVWNNFFRRNDIDLRADPAHAQFAIGWVAKTRIKDLVNILLEAEAKRNKTTVDELRNKVTTRKQSAGGVRASA